MAALTSNLSTLSTLDRLALPYELNTLASAGAASTVDYLKLVKGYSNETGKRYNISKFYLWFYDYSVTFHFYDTGVSDF